MKPGENRKSLSPGLQRWNDREKQKRLVRFRGNNAERVAIQHLLAERWVVYTKGWPDIIAERGGRIRVIEVKPQGRSLTRDQKAVIALLRKCGLTVEVWRPAETGHTSREDLQQQSITRMQGKLQRIRGS